ncbi:hypothetical protein LR013_04440 [candidate division NPL-UPA2 bacterium]|nr:hypothetical protein [candidate division NPL-UPA2 bacterium]
MFSKNLILIACITTLLSLPSLAQAEELASARRDQLLFKRLLSQRTEVHRLYLQALEEGMNQLKEEGEISLGVQDAILRHREEKDRIKRRLISLSLRHGWEIPELPETGLMAPQANLELDKVFQPARALIKARLRQYAASFIVYIELPRLTLREGG